MMKAEASSAGKGTDSLTFSCPRDCSAIKIGTEQALDNAKALKNASQDFKSILF